MTDYGKLWFRIWSDPEFRALDARPQQTYCLLISFPTRNLAGVLPLTLRRWTKATADATSENVLAALSVLVAARFILIDYDTEEVLVRTLIRNDEVWKQPNLMISCLKYCQATASPLLRRAIADELRRLVPLMPTDKPAQQRIRDVTATVAVELAETPSEGFTEPIAEPFPEPFREPPMKGFTEPTQTPFREPIAEPPVVVTVVGEGVLGTKEVNKNGEICSAPYVSNTPARDDTFDLATSERNNLSKPVSVGASRLVATVIPHGRVRDADRTILRLRTSEALAEGRTDDDMAECLRIWLTKTDLGPHGLLCCLTEVDKRKLNHAGMPTSDRRFLEVQALKSRPAMKEIPES